MKRYTGLKTRKVELQMPSRVLAGSVTMHRIKIGDLDVAEFETGFKEDFKDIKFD